MNKCGLTYIPNHLHWDDKPIIDEFEVGDVVYHRCSPDKLANPYLSISLTELSHNLGTNKGDFISNENDVLFSIKEEEPFQSYEGKAICVLEIKDLNTNNKYHKTFEGEKLGKKHIGEIAFLHEPDSCMYPHCVFRIWLDGVLVNYENYKETLGNVKNVRTLLKDEFTKMIRRREISQKD